MSGLYGITVPARLPGALLCTVSSSVGLTNAPAPFDNPTAQSVTLSVTDYAFPGPLASASALLTAGVRSWAPRARWCPRRFRHRQAL